MLTLRVLQDLPGTDQVRQSQELMLAPHGKDLLARSSTSIGVLRTVLVEGCCKAVEPSWFRVAPQPIPSLLLTTND
ncbi:MAG: hypothetical protein CM15mP85_24660 [Rhodobacterales bacterium]|nr:MAG: hypothetical protein CM15mP85_24660 [Rhodobacterales bacterium]